MLLRCLQKALQSCACNCMKKWTPLWNKKQKTWCYGSNVFSRLEMLKNKMKSFECRKTPAGIQFEEFHAIGSDGFCFQESVILKRRSHLYRRIPLFLFSTWELEVSCIVLCCQDDVETLNYKTTSTIKIQYHLCHPHNERWPVSLHRLLTLWLPIMICSRAPSTHWNPWSGRPPPPSWHLVSISLYSILNMIRLKICYAS